MHIRKFIIAILLAFNLICYSQSGSNDFKIFNPDQLGTLSDTILYKIKENPLDFLFDIAGWSEDGKILTWNVTPQYSGYGYYITIFSIIDLTSNTLLLSDVLFTLSDTMTVIMNEDFTGNLIEALQSNHIYNIQSTSQIFPGKIANNIIDIDVKVNELSHTTYVINCPGHEDGVCMCLKADIKESLIEGVIKLDGDNNFKEFNLKLDNYYTFKTVGFCKSPFEDRIAIIFRYSYYTYFSLLDVEMEDIILFGVDLHEILN
ncbi:MAG: hypothetical protein JXB49_06055 [Bacteroidales bacterium]|nr:hypothetical protein [Bacteroidales bacterium]